MGYYDEARNAGFSQGFSQGILQGISQGYSLACDNAKKLFRKLEDTGRRQFTIDDINAILNELRNLSVAALEGNGEPVAEE